MPPVDATQFLLQLLSTEIARDGGACLVTSLKDYAAVGVGRRQQVTSKRLNALVVEAIRKPRLLSFLETYPHVFQVDRHHTPHWVVLQSWYYVDFENLDHRQRHWHRDIDTTTTPQFEHKVRHAQLDHKILYILRQRSAKLQRRGRRPELQNIIPTENAETTKLETDHHNHPSSPEKFYAHNQSDDPTSKQKKFQVAGINISWLLRECCWTFHEYLRQSGIYLERIYAMTSLTNEHGPCGDVSRVQPVGSRSWLDLVLDEFLQYLLLLPSDGDEQVLIDVVHKKAWYHTTTKDILTSQLRAPLVSQHSQCIALDANQSAAAVPYLRLLDETLTTLVEQDGATQVRLTVLLYRYQELRRILGGRDLWDLVEQSRQTKDGPHYFERLDIVKDGSDLVLQSKSINFQRGRMKVDHEGLYSLANGKWAKAMANSMVRACQQVGWAQVSKNKCLETVATYPHIPAIDLTASVGGIVVGLAKTRFFSPVIGIEINSHRAHLCHENMTQILTEECRETVQIRCMDAMDAIPTLPSRSCLVIDPPWGGTNYKQMCRNQKSGDKQQSTDNLSSQSSLLSMGPWTLEDVLDQIYRYLRPCLVGLRLPITFSVQDWLQGLKRRICDRQRGQDCRDRGSSMQTIMVRKMSVQLFVVLYFPEQQKGACDCTISSESSNIKDGFKL